MIARGKTVRVVIRRDLSGILRAAKKVCKAGLHRNHMRTGLTGQIVIFGLQLGIGLGQHTSFGRQVRGSNHAIGLRLERPERPQLLSQGQHTGNPVLRVALQRERIEGIFRAKRRIETARLQLQLALKVLQRRPGPAVTPEDITRLRDQRVSVICGFAGHWITNS